MPAQRLGCEVVDQCDAREDMTKHPRSEVHGEGDSNMAGTASLGIEQHLQLLATAFCRVGRETLQRQGAALLAPPLQHYLRPHFRLRR